MDFTVSLTSPSTVPVTIHYNTVDRTATAGSDYIATSGILTIPAGKTTATIPVTIISDSTIEQNETFSMFLSSPTNATILTPQSIGTIVDDDAPVAVVMSINDVAMYRGLDGSKTMLFTVGLTAPATSNISVTVSTSDLTFGPANLLAHAGVDYQAKSQVLTFAPGETSKTFAVTIYGTSALSPDKLFYVNLVGATVATTHPIGAGILKYGA